MLLEQLELVDVKYEDEGAKAILIFLDEERGEIREVNFNTKVYDTDIKKFVPDAEKITKVEEWCKEYFELTYDTLNQAIGVKKDVYAYDNFNSLWESTQIKKFEDDMVGQIIDVVVTEVLIDNIGIHVRFGYEEETYNSNMNYSEYMEALNKWFVNPQKKLKQESKFKEKFHLDIENAQELVGQTVMVEVKKAMGKYVYCEIKPFPKRKK